MFSAAAVLTAVATSGIVFSFNGFQSPINMAGEARNPARDVPIAVLGSIALATVIYVLLQVAFIGATPSALLSKGWAAVNFSSPFAQLAIALNLNWLALLLYADAFASPSGTGATYTATSARMIYAMERSGALPAFLGGIHEKTGIPRHAMWLDLVVSFLFLFFFRGWGSLASVISVACIISYLAGPVSVATLRRTAPGIRRPLRLPALQGLAGVTFVVELDADLERAERQHRKEGDGQGQAKAEPDGRTAQDGHVSAVRSNAPHRSGWIAWPRPPRGRPGGRRLVPVCPAGRAAPG